MDWTEDFCVKFPTDEANKLKMDIINYGFYIKKDDYSKDEKIGSVLLARTKLNFEGEDLNKWEKMLRYTAREKNIRLTSYYESHFNYKK